MYRYAHYQSIGDLLRNTFVLYRKHVLLMLLVCSLPMLPIIVSSALSISPATSMKVPSLLFLMADIGGHVLARFATALVMMDICMGNRPSAWRSYRRIFRRFSGRLLLLILCITFINLLPHLVGSVFKGASSRAGFLLLAMAVWLVVTVALYTWGLLWAVALVAEDVSIKQALKRSVQLGKGRFLRNFAIFWGTAFVLFLPALVANVVKQLMPEVVWAFPVIIIVFSALVLPLGRIAIVLIYLDMRAQKESFDLELLSQDLRR
jgi:hypothetical protein